jgi:hypothetical protein
MRNASDDMREINETLARAQPEALTFLHGLANDPNQAIANEARRIAQGRVAREARPAGICRRTRRTQP